MTKCPYCSRENADEAASCHYCGSDLSVERTGADVAGRPETWRDRALRAIRRGPPWLRGPVEARPWWGRLRWVGYIPSWERLRAGAERACRGFRRWPRWAQALTWVVGFPYLIPISLLGGGPGPTPAELEADKAEWAPRLQSWQDRQIGRASSRARASLVWGIVGVPLFFLLVPSLVAVVKGFGALKGIKLSGGTEEGRGAAIAGIVLGIIGMVPLILLMVATAACEIGGGTPGGCSI